MGSTNPEALRPATRIRMAHIEPVVGHDDHDVGPRRLGRHPGGRRPAERRGDRWYFRIVISRRRWLAGWGLIAGTYLALALARLVEGASPDSVIVYLVAAAITFGFAAAVLPFVLPRGRGDDDDPPDGDGPDRDPPPPWWPEFEREFWRQVRDAREHRSPAEPRPQRERAPV